MVQTPLQRKKNEAFSQNAKKGIKPSSAKKVKKDELEDAKIDFRRKMMIYAMLGIFFVWRCIIFPSTLY
ncbi:hypothetical protein DSO57_1008011 [Entomophthora muscae]|uniref:Uncharacterized protein n=2 Tax=Entomophthora muscae TaxID=34485 RepID=A0ACC2UH55_9FUNG|nr:hypothetical protein DSO57_1008011 [Entomophthora muscae]